jgi:cytochrome b561
VKQEIKNHVFCVAIHLEIFLTALFLKVSGLLRRYASRNDEPSFVGIPQLQNPDSQCSSIRKRFETASN